MPNQNYESWGGGRYPRLTKKKNKITQVATPPPELQIEPADLSTQNASKRNKKAMEAGI
jgi:hypothetical protein